LDLTVVLVVDDVELVLAELLELVLDDVVLDEFVVSLVVLELVVVVLLVEVVVGHTESGSEAHVEQHCASGSQLM
jgi:hypothetical protein